MFAHTGKVNQIVAVKQGVNDFSKTGVADGQCCGERAELGSCAGSRRREASARGEVSRGWTFGDLGEEWKARGGLVGLNGCGSGGEPAAALST